jgi:signal transduction histidine kinase
MQLVRKDFADASATAVRAEPGSVEQVLLNLVDNACKYAAKAEDRHIHIELEAGAKHVIIRVTDHGPGLPAAQRRRLFRAFNKSADEAALSAPGVGLGLALSRRLARSMGGDLRLDKRYKGGAAFEFLLPRA